MDSRGKNMTWFLKSKIKKLKKKITKHDKEIKFQYEEMLKAVAKHNELVAELNGNLTFAPIGIGQPEQQQTPQEQIEEHQPMEEKNQWEEKLDQRKQGDKQDFAKFMQQRKNAARAKRGQPPIQFKQDKKQVQSSKPQTSQRPFKQDVALEI